MRVTTTSAPDATWELIDRLANENTAFIRNGDGIIGFGSAVRISARGANRISELADKWRELVQTSEVDDSVRIPGSGLVAFGSIAFSGNSSAESVLVVPKVVLGKRDGRRWITIVDDATVPESQEALRPAPVDLHPGAQSRDGFEASVARAVREIEAGRVQKVVLARDLVGWVEPNFDLRPTLSKLAAKYPSCWVYNVDGMFGASPELLVRVSHGQVSARVLAGTATRGTEPSIDQAISAALAASGKNLSEHQFAVDSLVQALEPFCDHVDADSAPFSLALPNVWHLASDVHGVLNANSSVLDLAEALHPTAAVAGTPRFEALELIEEIEPFDRGRYAGPVGWIGADGDGEWAIALRGAQLTETEIRAYAGCGIVAESEPAAELAETDLKFMPITEALA